MSDACMHPGMSTCGKRWTYRDHGCRGAACRAANADYIRERRVATAAGTPLQIVGPTPASLPIVDELRRVVTERTWADAAACKGMDPELFFDSTGDHYARARAVCATCPVRDECREEAIENREQYGMWGGTSRKDRDQIRRQRRKAVA